jgi:hypothetical protein
LQRFVLDSLRFGSESGDATIGIFTWNQVSGLVSGVGGLIAFWWLGKSQRQASPEMDSRLVAATASEEST